MKKSNTSFQWALSFCLLIIIGGFSNCTSLLTAKFESDTLGNLPNKTLPGNPSGDEMLYAAEIENQLEVITTPGSSAKSVEYQGNTPTGSISGHSAWVTFKAKIK